MENNQKSLNKRFFSYCLYPDIRFETYQPGENIILLLRAHPFTQVHWMVNSIILALILAGLNFIMPAFFNLSQIFFFNVFCVIFLLSFIFYNFIIWYFNVGIITDKRVIDIDFSSILYKQVVVTRLGEIEDITDKSAGYFESLFDYGNVFIQTAGTQDNIEFTNIPFPSQVVEKINSLLPENHESE
ncbi:hypothetical protein M1328_05680 [Patescibacteria group bacterium]|nr:hypothetical protein [Patescibacteria group bacterium]